MNSTGKFLVSALLIHAANLKKAGETQSAIAIPRAVAPANGNDAQPSSSGK
jgi:hypothetical protein